MAAIGLFIALCGVVVLALLLLAAVKGFARSAHRASTWRARNAQWQAVVKQVKHLCHAHGHALTSQFRAKTFQDQYGVIVYDGWNKELRAFTQRVVVPHLLVIGSPLSQYLATNQQWASMNSPVPTAKRQTLRQTHTQMTVTVTAVGNTFSVLSGDGAPARAPSNLAGLDRTTSSAILDLVTVEANAIVTHMLKTANFVRSRPEVIQNGDEFERWCAAELRSAGWMVFEIGGAGDHGIDLIGQRAGLRCGFQCKCLSSPASNAAVQEAFGGAAVHALPHCAVISKSGFRKSARQASAATKVHLVNADELARFHP